MNTPEWAASKSQIENNESSKQDVAKKLKTFNKSTSPRMNQTNRTNKSDKDLIEPNPENVKDIQTNFERTGSFNTFRVNNSDAKLNYL